MSHAAGAGEQTSDAGMSPRVARGVLIAGWALLLVGAAAYAAIAVVVGSSSRLVLGMPLVFAILAVLIGAACVGLADVARRRVGYAQELAPAGPPTARASAYRYRVRMIAWPLQALWIVVLAVAYTLIFPVQLAGGALSRPANVMVQVMFFLPAMALAALVGGALVSLVKKLSYPAQLRWRARSAAGGGAAARVLLYLWRVDIWLGAAGGVVAGVAAQPAATGNAAAAATLVVIGGLLFLVGAALSLTFWRSGEALDDVVIGAPRVRRIQ